MPKSTAVSFTVAGLDKPGTGTVTFSDGVNPDVVVSVTGNGTYTVNLHSLKDGSITSALSFTDTEGNLANAPGNSVTLDTDKTEVATLSVNDTADHVINNAKSTTVSFTVGGLDDTGTGTVTFSDVPAIPMSPSPSPATAPIPSICIRSRTVDQLVVKLR